MTTGSHSPHMHSQSHHNQQKYNNQHQQQQQQQQYSGNNGASSNNNSTSSKPMTLTLPGTFKSMLTPTVCGDISIQISGCSAGTLTDLLNGTIAAQTPTAAGMVLNGVKNDSVQARIQFNYRLPSVSGGDLAASMAPPSPSTNQRRHVAECRGKIAIMTVLKSVLVPQLSQQCPPSPPSVAGDSHDEHHSSGSGVGAGAAEQSNNVIKQYEMMFVQQDFELGPQRPFLAINFGKTLVTNVAASGVGSTMGVAAVNENADDSNSQFEKGLMLSGHYTCLHSHDVGTVRVHLPSHAIPGELSPALNIIRIANTNLTATTATAASVEAASAVNESLRPPSPPVAVSSLQAFPPLPPASSSTRSSPPRRISINNNNTFTASVKSSSPAPPASAVVTTSEEGTLQIKSSQSPGQLALNDRPLSPRRYTVAASPGASFSHAPVVNGEDYHNNRSRRRQFSNSVSHATQQNKPVRYCYGCGESGHLHKDCPSDQLFCYNCNQAGHSSKNCKLPKPWEQSQSSGGPPVSAGGSLIGATSSTSSQSSSSTAAAAAAAATATATTAISNSNINSNNSSSNNNNNNGIAADQSSSHSQQQQQKQFQSVVGMHRNRTPSPMISFHHSRPAAQQQQQQHQQHHHQTPLTPPHHSALDPWSTMSAQFSDNLPPYNLSGTATNQSPSSLLYHGHHHAVYAAAPSSISSSPPRSQFIGGGSGSTGPASPFASPQTFDPHFGFYHPMQQPHQNYQHHQQQQQQQQQSQQQQQHQYYGSPKAVGSPLMVGDGLFASANAQPMPRRRSFLVPSTHPLSFDDLQQSSAGGQQD